MGVFAFTVQGGSHCGNPEVLVGRMTHEEMKAGKTFAVDGLGTVRVGIRKLMLGLVQAIDVHCNEVRCKGHELLNYRGNGVT